MRLACPKCGVHRSCTNCGFGSGPYISIEETQRRVQKVLRSVAGHFGVRVEEILGQGRNTRLVHARKLVAMRLRADTEMQLTYQAIGYYLGGRDHSTIIHYFRGKKRKEAA